MSFHASYRIRDDAVIITMSGDLDATTAPVFKESVDQAVGPGAKHLVLDMRELDYLSSAGLRQLIHARQKMDDDVQIELVGVKDRVAQTIRLVGFDQSVTFSESLPE